MGNKIESIEDIKKYTKGFVFGSLPSFPSDPANGQWKPGCKAYEWCKNDIQRLGGVKYWTKFFDKKEKQKLVGVYIIGKYDFFGQDLKEETIRKEAFDLIIPQSTSEEILYPGMSGNVLSRIGTMRVPTYDSASKTSKQYSPHAVLRWRQKENFKAEDLWCLVLITNDTKLARAIEKYLHNLNQVEYGHPHRLWEYTNNKTAKGYDFWSVERWNDECVANPDRMKGLEGIEKAMKVFKTGQDMIMKQILKEKCPTLSKLS